MSQLPAKRVGTTSRAASKTDANAVKTELFDRFRATAQSRRLQLAAAEREMRRETARRNPQLPDASDAGITAQRFLDIPRRCVRIAPFLVAAAENCLTDGRQQGLEWFARRVPDECVAYGLQLLRTDPVFNAVPRWSTPRHLAPPPIDLNDLSPRQVHINDLLPLIVQQRPFASLGLAVSFAQVFSAESIAGLSLPNANFWLPRWLDLLAAWGTSEQGLVLDAWQNYGELAWDYLVGDKNRPPTSDAFEVAMPRVNSPRMAAWQSSQNPTYASLADLLNLQGDPTPSRWPDNTAVSYPPGVAGNNTRPADRQFREVYGYATYGTYGMVDPAHAPHGATPSYSYNATPEQPAAKPAVQPAGEDASTDRPSRVIIRRKKSAKD